MFLKGFEVSETCHDVKKNGLIQEYIDTWTAYRKHHTRKVYQLVIEHDDFVRDASHKLIGTCNSDRIAHKRTVCPENWCFQCVEVLKIIREKIISQLFKTHEIDMVEAVLAIKIDGNIL